MSIKQKYHFTYKTTCLTTSKYYYGMHSTSSLKDNYLGSGKRLRASLYKHGRENHKLEILEFFPDKKALAEAESKLITEDLLKDPMCMNLKPGGEGGFANVDHRDKCSAAGRAGLKKKLEDPEYKRKFIERCNSSETMKKLHELGKMSQKGEKNSQFGTKWMTNGSENKPIKKNQVNNYLNMGWVFGRTTK